MHYGGTKNFQIISNKRVRAFNIYTFLTGYQIQKIFDLTEECLGMVVLTTEELEA